MCDGDNSTGAQGVVRGSVVAVPAVAVCVCVQRTPRLQRRRSGTLGRPRLHAQMYISGGVDPCLCSSGRLLPPFPPNPPVPQVVGLAGLPAGYTQAALSDSTSPQRAALDDQLIDTMATVLGRDPVTITVNG